MCSMNLSIVSVESYGLLRRVEYLSYSLTLKMCGLIHKGRVYYGCSADYNYRYDSSDMWLCRLFIDSE